MQLRNAVESKVRAPVPSVASRRGQRAVLIFHVAGQAYGIALDEIQEVVPMALLSRPPALPTLLAGFLNLGGTALPVVRLDRLFRLPEQRPGLYTPLLILRHPDSQLALLADRISRVVHVTENDFVPIQAYHSLNDCTEGVITVDGHVIPLLSAARLLSEKEQQCLAELQDREQARLRDLEGAGP